MKVISSNNRLIDFIKMQKRTIFFPHQNQYNLNPECQCDKIRHKIQGTLNTAQGYLSNKKKIHPIQKSFKFLKGKYYVITFDNVRLISS